MGSLEVAHLAWSLPGGRTLLQDVSFRVGEGEHVALVGTNGVGKTTLLALIAGDEQGHTGTIRVDGRLGVMRQLVGSLDDCSTVRDLYLSLSPPAVRAAGHRLEERERKVAEGGEREAMRYADALAHWGDVGGYDAEVLWEKSAMRAVGLTWADIRERSVSTFSGGEQKRLALFELLLRSDDDVLLLDEPDNFLDVPGKRWLAEQLNATPKTVLYVSHDRELLAQTSHKVVTVEGRGAWTLGGSYEGWQEARIARAERLDDEHRRWAAERKRLEVYLREMKRRAAISDANARRAKAAETRLRHFDEAGPPPERARDQHLSMRLGGGRTGKRVVIAEQLKLTGLTDPFDLEIDYGERVAVLGPNGTGKSHLLRLLAGGTVEHEGSWRLGARVEPAYFSQTHEHPELRGSRLLEILAGLDLDRGRAMAALRRYELSGNADQPWETLSGGQQARFQILLLETEGSTLLLLDEPTDNLDVESAEALEAGLASFVGTVIAVTHDRWFLRSFERFVVIGDDGKVREVDDPELAF